jgi:hypothetical protein
MTFRTVRRCSVAVVKSIGGMKSGRRSTPVTSVRQGSRSAPTFHRVLTLTRVRAVLWGLSYQRARALRALFQPQLRSGVSGANEIRVRRTRRAQLCLKASKLRSDPVRV